MFIDVYIGPRPGSICFATDVRNVVLKIAIYVNNTNEKFTNSLDNHEATVGVFIDLKKAFDTVDHSILIEKLYHYCGIRGTANKCICSYLMNRYQYNIYIYM